MTRTSGRWFGYLLVFVVLFLAPLFTRAEHIHSFDVAIELHKDATAVVTEEIRYVFTTPRHGIFRYIPTQHPQDPSTWYKERYIDVELGSVLMDGNPVPFTVEEERDQLYLKIGDPVVTIEGEHTYTFTYKLRGAYSFIQHGGAEFFWNVTGEEWPVPIRAASVTVSDPDSILTSARSCYAGNSGAGGSCARASTTASGLRYTHFELMPGQGMSFAVGLNRDLVDRVVLERNQLFMVWIGLFIVWLIGLIVVIYRYRTAYKTGNTIIAQYEPYEGVKPMYAGLLYDGTLHPQDITASIVYLAEQGFIRIRETKDKVLFFFEVSDYEITLLRPATDTESPFQRTVLTLLFGEAVAVGTQVTLLDLKKDLGKQRENQKILRTLQSDLSDELQKDGFFQESPVGSILFRALIGLVVLVVAIGISRSFISISTPVIIGIGAVYFTTVLVILLANERRTRKGYEALDHLEGFREYLSVAEKDRLAFHNAPQKSPTEFMKNLPYAIALGVEEEWAAVFKDVTIPNPGWYDGNTGAAFSAVHLTESLGAFSTAFTSSSGSSASSGGGSVGGGGGGGGGGSW